MKRVTGGRPLARIPAFRAIRTFHVQQRTADGEITRRFAQAQLSHASNAASPEVLRFRAVRRPPSAVTQRSCSNGS